MVTGSIYQDGDGWGGFHIGEQSWSGSEVDRNLWWCDNILTDTVPTDISERLSTTRENLDQDQDCDYNKDHSLYLTENHPMVKTESKKTCHIKIFGSFSRCNSIFDMIL